MDEKDAHVPKEHHVPRTGDWLSQDARHHHQWMKETIEHVDAHPRELHPVIVEFKEMVEGDSRLYMLFSAMFDELPKNKKYLSDPSGQMKNIRDFQHMLRILNHLIHQGPRWTDAGHTVGVVGVPIQALLDWPMGTVSGFAAFQDDKVNAMLKKVLDAWGAFLSSEESAKVLQDHKTGWFGETGKQSLVKVANIGKTDYKFEEMFVCQPDKPNYGYKSWDDFFTRPFKEGIRPVASPDDDSVIANACESKPYKVAHSVGRRDKFWAKGQSYSVVDMLAQDKLAEHFVGGTIYQAFLSALSYHRWHSPISGKVVKTVNVPGTYFSEPLCTGFMDGQAADMHAQSTTQEYLSVMATRAIIYIQADNPKIGLVAFIGIGMVEVSTCEITVKEGQHLSKGDQLGSFHFGGSTHCVMFSKGVKLEGFPEPGQRTMYQSAPSWLV